MGRSPSRAVCVVALAALLDGVCATAGTQAARAAPRMAPRAPALSPNPSSTGNFLSGVSAVSATDAWAVGYYDNSSGVGDTLILHWNGTAWSKVKSPNPSSTSNVLSGVSAVSATDAWAVGDYQNNTTGADDTLILHWNGTSWSRT
jgi:hypothetical protein